MVVALPRIRPARLSDAPGIARVHNDVTRDTRSGLFADSYFIEAAIKFRAAYWTSILSALPDDEHVFVADLGGSVVGFARSEASLGPAGNNGHPPARSIQLSHLYVLTSQHGTGVGQALLDAVLSDADAQLWVAIVDARARAFYERNRFRADGVELVNEEVPDLTEIRMVR